MVHFGFFPLAEKSYEEKHASILPQNTSFYPSYFWDFTVPVTKAGQI